MTSELAATAGLGLYILGVLVTFGVRTWAHQQATGSSGFRRLSGPPGSAPWWGGVLFAASLVLTALGLILAATGTVPAAPLPAAAVWAGLAVALTGFATVVLAQSGMGTSWRIGVDPTERTALITGGPFAIVRNPIFTAMLITATGLTLIIPNIVSIIGLAVTVAALELQVRLVEEPYLRELHGDRYLEYTATVGRFVPHVGRTPR